MTLADAPPLAVAAFAAGVLNAIAGGGSFFDVTRARLHGHSAHRRQRHERSRGQPGLSGQHAGVSARAGGAARRRLLVEAGIAAIGGVLGAALLLVTPASAFRALVPWLLLFATLVFQAGPHVVRWLAAHHLGANGTVARHLGLLAVAIYGGYFNGGLGILLMGLYTVTGETRIQTANALKNLNSLVLSLLSVATFAVAGAVAWTPALLMMAAATMGGYAGARWAQRLPAAAVRAIVIATGLAMSAVFFWRG